MPVYLDVHVYKGMFIGYILDVCRCLGTRKCAYDTGTATTNRDIGGYRTPTSGATV